MQTPTLDCIYFRSSSTVWLRNTRPNGNTHLISYIKQMFSFRLVKIILQPQNVKFDFACPHNCSSQLGHTFNRVCRAEKGNTGKKLKATSFEQSSADCLLPSLGQNEVKSLSYYKGNHIRVSDFTKAASKARGHSGARPRATAAVTLAKSN